jgi:DNA-binding CsgD family transcriptional regulator
VLFGEAGVGKTTLARAVTQSLPTQVHWVAGTESARSIPLGVFAHLVGPAASRDPIAGLAAARETICRVEHSVIGVDDAHLLDHLSATLVHQLALEGSVRIVAAVRSGEVVPDAITSLWKDGYLKLLKLSPFSKTQFLRLVENALGGRLEGLSGDVMWAASGGNALYIRHLVDGALEAGTLRQVRGVWQLRGGTAVTSELASLLDARIEQLPDEDAHALQLLSFAEPLALDVLSRLVGDETVERVEQRGLIRVVEGPAVIDVRFTHPLYGEVIRRGLGRAATRRLKGELFRVMKEQPIHRPAERIRLAELALDSDVNAETELFESAAQDAIALTNITLGERLARAAVARDGGLVTSELLARSLLWQGKAAEAEEVLSAFDPETMNELDLVRWGMARIANLHWSMGDAARAEEVLHLLQRKVTHPALQLVVEGMSATTNAFENRLDEAGAAAQRVLSDPEASPTAIEWAVFGGALAAALAGRVEDAAAMVARGRAIDDKVDGLIKYPTAYGEIRALTLVGAFDEAESRSRDIVQVTSPGQYLAWGMANVLVGTVEVARGRFGAVGPRMEETVAALAAESASSWNFPAGMMLAQAHCVLGKVEAAARTVAELRGKVDRHVRVFTPQFRLVEAWLSAAEGHVTGAMAGAIEAADLARDSGQRAVEMCALHDAARFGDIDSLQRLVDVAGGIGGRLAEAHAAYAAALIANDPVGVFAASERFEAIGSLLAAADAAAQAAVLFREAGDRRQAVEAAASADRLAAACGGVRTPALELAAEPLPLSPREREIANFVAQGLGNRDIADRLVVSPRTVEGHIYRACIKLDVTDREGLAIVIRRGRGG